jgi:hypothetical protein
VTMTQPYSSTTCVSGRDSIAPTTKFSVPTVANGFVYVGTQGPIANTGERRGCSTYLGRALRARARFERPPAILPLGLGDPVAVFLWESRLGFTPLSESG